MIKQLLEEKLIQCIDDEVAGYTSFRFEALGEEKKEQLKNAIREAMRE